MKKVLICVAVLLAVIGPLFAGGSKEAENK